MDHNSSVLVFASLAVALLLYLKNQGRTVLPFPPGPKKLPLLGNLLDIPRSFEWKVYAQWSKQYGSAVIHLSAAGNDIVVLNSLKVASDLCEKRSSIYSSRPQFTLISKLMGWKWLMSAMVYGEPWKERRRLFQQYFHPGNTKLYEPGQMEAVRKMLPRILDAPENFLAISRHTIGGLALSLAYGLNIQEENDPFIAVTEKAGNSITEASVPGAFLVDFLPILQYVPEWVPGAGWKKKVRAWRRIQEDFREVPFKAALEDMASGLARPSFASVTLNMLDPQVDTAHRREVIKDTAGIVFAAGADTTLASVHTFFAAMLYFPDVQRRAQAELDTVLKGRLPEFGDEKDLPYVAALVKEVLRWQPATPIAVPHCVTEDDVYEGYHIPKNALIIGNVWAMLHDEEDYPEPSSFRPERFLKGGQLDPTVRDPVQIAFGFGRRVCPGAHIATSVLWLTAASVLSAFSISEALDEAGLPIEPAVEWKSGLICRPLPFKCTIKLRSAAAEAVVRSGADAY